jgi:hypothetical protein
LVCFRKRTDRARAPQYDLVVDVCDSDEEIIAVVTERTATSLKARTLSDATDATNATTTGASSVGDSAQHAALSSLLDETVQSAHDSSSDVATPQTHGATSNALRHTSSGSSVMLLRRASNGAGGDTTENYNESTTTTANNNNSDKRLSRLKTLSGNSNAVGEDSLVVARRRVAKERSAPKDRLLDNSEYTTPTMPTTSTSTKRQYGSSGSGDEDPDDDDDDAATAADVDRGSANRGNARKQLVRGKKAVDPKLAATALLASSGGGAVSPPPTTLMMTTTTTANGVTAVGGNGSGRRRESDDDDDLDRNAATTTTQSRSLKDMLLSQSSEKIAGSVLAGAVFDDDDELAMTLRVAVPQVSRTIAFDVSVDNTAVDVLRVVRERLPNLPPPASGNAYWLQQTGGAVCPMHKSLLELRVMPHELLTLVERPGVDVTAASRGAELMRKLNELDRVVQEHNQRELAAEIHAALESTRGTSPPLLAAAVAAVAAGAGVGANVGGATTSGFGSSSPAIVSSGSNQSSTLKRVNDTVVSTHIRCWTVGKKTIS